QHAVDLRRHFRVSAHRSNLSREGAFIERENDRLGTILRWTMPRRSFEGEFHVFQTMSGGALDAGDGGIEQQATDIVAGIEALVRIADDTGCALALQGRR